MWESDEEDDAMIHFEPTDQEIIKDYLKKKIDNKPCGDFIVHKDVYAKEPWLLDHNNKDDFFKKHEWFYFVTRTQVSELKIGCGKNSKRKIIGDNGDRGNWKANWNKDIIDEKTGDVIGVMQNLSYNKNNENKKKKKQKIGNGSSSSSSPGSHSSWIMDEYMLKDGVKFQKLVLCKIKEIKMSKKKDDDHEASAAGEGNMAHLSEPQLKEDDQVHTYAPLGHDSSSLPIHEAADEEDQDWIQDLESDLLMVKENDHDAAEEGSMARPDEQVHPCAPLGHDSSSIPIQEAAIQEDQGWIKDFVRDLLMMKENDQDFNYNSSSTSWTDEVIMLP